MLQRIRTQLVVLFLAIALAGILGTAISVLKLWVADKRAYVTELGSVLAPQISEALGQKIQLMLGEVKLLERLISSPNRGASRALASSLTEKFAGAKALQLQPAGKSAIRVALGPGPVNPEIWRWAAEHSDPGWSAEVSASGERVPILGVALPSGGRATIVLDPAFFKDAFELGRGLPTVLVDAHGGAVYRSPAARAIGTTPAVPAQALTSSAVVAEELELAPGRRFLATFASLGNPSLGAVAVFAPSMSASELVAPLARSALGFLVGLVVVGVALGLLFSAGIARPIEELTQATSAVGAGHWAVLLRSRPRNEIGKLVKAFSKMVKNLAARERELQEAQQKLIQSESLAAVGRFSSGIAHEVKNPLNSILGYAQLIDRMGPSSAQTPSYLKFIMEETRRASRIISDLLMFSRQKPPQLASVDVAEFLKGFEERVGPLAEQAGAAFSVEAEPSLKAMLDSEQLHQVLLNLSQNALQAMEQTKEKKLSLSARREAERIVVRVTDTGPGIAPENLPRLFEPFFSTKEVGKGSGLGLALCHGIVQQHGGTIEARSAPGQGATFEISLPAL